MPDQDLPARANSSDPVTAQPIPVSPGLNKEKELGTPDEIPFESIPSDVEVEPGLEKVGVIPQRETIELPPDMRNMGVTAAGAAQPVTAATTTIKLPLSDDQIELALHAKVMQSIRWLAEWCVRQLKKAHIHLKKISGRVVREQE